MEKGVNIFYNALEFLLTDLKKQRELCVDQRINWLKNLYLNLFYDNAHKRFQCPTPMQALLAFGGRQFNLNTLENSFHASVNSLLLTLFTNNDTHQSDQISNTMAPASQPTAQHSPSSAIVNLNKSNDLNNLDSLVVANETDVLKKKTNIIMNASERKSSFRQRKSSTSISSFRGRTFKSKFKSETMVQTNKSNQHSVVSSKTPPPLADRFSKLKSFRQKSLVYEIFARSSSASLERQTSFDSGSYTNHQKIRKLKSKHNMSNSATRNANSNNLLSGGVNAKDETTNNFSKNLKTNNQKTLISNSTSPTSSIMSKNNPILMNMLNCTSKRITMPFKKPILFSLIKTKKPNSQEQFTTILVFISKISCYLHRFRLFF